MALNRALNTIRIVERMETCRSCGMDTADYRLLERVLTRRAPGSTAAGWHGWRS